MADPRPTTAEALRGMVEALERVADGLVNTFTCECFTDDLPDGEPCPCEGEGRAADGSPELEGCWRCEGEAARAALSTWKSRLPVADNEDLRNELASVMRRRYRLEGLVDMREVINAIDAHLFGGPSDTKEGT